MPQKTRMKGGHASTKTEQRMQAPPVVDLDDKSITVHPKNATGVRSMVIRPKETPKERMARVVAAQNRRK